MARLVLMQHHDTGLCVALFGVHVREGKEGPAALCTHRTLLAPPSPRTRAFMQAHK